MASAEARAYLKQSALSLVRLARKHFRITGSGDRLKVETLISAEDVSSFLREYRARVRPATLSDAKLRLAPSHTSLRTLLWTRPAADAVLNDVVRLSMYSDEVVVIDPFSVHIANVPATSPPGSPFVRPELWTHEFGNHALMVCALERWIESDLVVLLPVARTFRGDAPSFTDLALRAMKEGKFALEPGPEILQDSLEGIALNTERDEDLPAMTRQVLGDKSERERQDLIDSMREFRRANPRRYTALADKGETVFSFASGVNIFEAAWIADDIGGYVVPRLALDRMNFRNFTRGDGAKDSIDALATAFAAAPLPMLNNVSLSDALDVRKSGRLSRFRQFLHSVWQTTSDPQGGAKSIERERALADAVKAMHAEASEEWLGIYKDLGVKGALSLFASGGLVPVIQAGITPVAAGALYWLYSRWSGPTKALRRMPSGLLVQLENQSSPNPIRRAVDLLERKL